MENRTQIQVKISSHFGDCVLGEGQLRPSFNGAGLRDIQCSTNMVLDTRLCIWFIMTVYYKTQQILLQNASDFVLLNATVITKCDDFIIKWNSYYKNATLITNCDSTKIYIATKITETKLMKNLKSDSRIHLSFQVTISIFFFCC